MRSYVIQYFQGCFSSFLLTEITNASFSSSSVPQTLKLALVIPLSPFCQKDWIIVRAIAFNSGFHSQHSTQSIVVTINLPLSSDSGFHSILVLLKLTAASQPYHYSLPSGILHHHWHCPVLAKIISDKQTAVCLCTSSTATLSQGVPQGSVLSPLLFILHMLSFGSLTSSYSALPLLH